MACFFRILGKVFWNSWCFCLELACSELWFGFLFFLKCVLGFEDNECVGMFVGMYFFVFMGMFVCFYGHVFWFYGNAFKICGTLFLNFGICFSIHDIFVQYFRCVCVGFLVVVW